MNALCQMTGLSRASYYRWLARPPGDAVEMELRAALQRIALAFPAYGYRRITAELKRRGFAVNHKRVLRLLREDNLLCWRHKSFRVTTDSRHALTVYPNLAAAITPSAVNQLWVADITYIRLRREFVYLAVLLDAYSRRVIGWALGPHVASRADGVGLTPGARSAAADAGAGASLRSWRAVCLWGLYGLAPAAPHRDQHEPQGQPLRQRPGGPQTPGICRFAARMRGYGGGAGRLRPFRRLSRRSGCVPAEPYPPLSYSQSGSHQPRRARRLQRTATTPLTDCLTIGVHFRSFPPTFRCPSARRSNPPGSCAPLRRASAAILLRDPPDVSRYTVAVSKLSSWQERGTSGWRPYSGREVPSGSCGRRWLPGRLPPRRSRW